MKHGDKVRRNILDAGVRLWRDNPSKLSARKIAAELRMSHASVLYHFGTAEGLRNAIASHAVTMGDQRVVAMLIAERHSTVAHLTAAERQAYLSTL
ncbi:MAG TPA: TetR family transcriptional regulator [Promineifilum sp.]|nr:TetR family transcriptional regulator [Promineifilum sp.]